MNAEHGEENVQVKPHAYVHSWVDLNIFLNIFRNILIMILAISLYASNFGITTKKLSVCNTVVLRILQPYIKY